MNKKHSKSHHRHGSVTHPAKLKMALIQIGFQIEQIITFILCWRMSLLYFTACQINCGNFYFNISVYDVEYQLPTKDGFLLRKAKKAKKKGKKGKGTKINKKEKPDKLYKSICEKEIIISILYMRKEKSHGIMPYVTSYNSQI